jgi:hypothetical protein
MICFSLLILSVTLSLLGNKEGGKLGVSAMLLIAHSVITWYSLSDKAAFSSSLCAPKQTHYYSWARQYFRPWARWYCYLCPWQHKMLKWFVLFLFRKNKRTIHLGVWKEKLSLWKQNKEKTLP